MIQPFRTVITLGVALVALSWASSAVAQSPADAKRTLKAQKVFYKEPGMIEVDVRYMRGTLMMTGYTPSEEGMKKADELAEEIKGVRDIRNRIRVRDPAVDSAPDEVILAAINKKIDEDEELQKLQMKGRLEVSVQQGNVVLKGKLQDYTQAGTLISDIRRVDGIKTLDFEDLKY